MTTHDLIQDQPIVAFAGAQRASKYVEISAAPIEPAAPVTMAVDDVAFALEADTEDTVAHELLDDDVGRDVVDCCAEQTQCRELLQSPP